MPPYLEVLKNEKDDKLSYDDKELEILRKAVDVVEARKGKETMRDPDIKKVIAIVENFIEDKKLVCYGGTAINNILPKYAQFYNKDVEIPDYDFFSYNALKDAKELADIYFQNGYTDVEAKSGAHPGTYKVFVNFIPVADITFLEKSLFEAILKEAITVEGIKYAPPNYLRMSMYLELSRPAGDVSRWEKVLKRLTLLNEHFPLSEIECHSVDFQRELENDSENSEKIYITVRDALIDQGVVFFGGYASSLYSKYMPENQKRLIRKVPDFDVLSEDPERSASIVIERLNNIGIKHVSKKTHPPIGEIIPEHIEIKVGRDTIAYIYRPIACHNYNTITMNEQKINIATIDTMLSFYLAFIYADEFSYFKNRILCMAKFLFEVEQKNRLEQKGLLKRFSIDCYGNQPTLEDIRAEKTAKFKELADKRGTPEYETWFLKYNPKEIVGSKKIREPSEKTENVSMKKSKTISKKSKIEKIPKIAKTRKFRDFFFF